MDLDAVILYAETPRSKASLPCRKRRALNLLRCLAWARDYRRQGKPGEARHWLKNASYWAEALKWERDFAACGQG